MSAPAAIRALLTDVRRRLRLLAAAQAGLYLASAAIFLAVGAPLVATGSGSGRGAAWLLLLAGLVALAGAVVGGLVAPAVRWRSDRQVASWVGQQVPTLASDLISSVELGEGARPAGQRGAFSPALVDALVESTAQRLGAVEADHLVPRQPLWRPARAMAVAALFAIAVAALAPARVSAGWRAMLSGDPGGRFAGADRSPVPLVGDLELTLHYPAYTGRESVRLPSASGEVRVLPGTRVAVETTALEPAASAWIAFGDETPGEGARPDLPLAVDGHHLRGEFEVTEPVKYRFLLAAENGKRRVEAITRAIEIEPDREPVVELHAPADELDVTGMKRIELAYVAEDDYGLTRAELVFASAGEKERRRPLELPGGGGRSAPKSAQNKLLWDLADVPLTPGTRVAYHVEVFDNDAVSGAKAGRSKEFYLRVLSPRERHERLIARQRELFENLVKALGGRLTAPPLDLHVHEALHKDSAALVVELGTVVAALDKDEMAAKQLRKALGEMRGRIDKLTGKEAKLLKRAGKGDKVPGALASAVSASDKAMVAELEDDVILLSDWLDRQDLENLLAINDEIKAHRDRLAKLFEEYKRTGSAEIKAEIERELRALEQRLAEQAQRQDRMAADVLDQFVNAEGLRQQKESTDCLAEVRKMMAAGDVAGAEKRLKECGEALDQSAEALEQALDELRGDRFSEQQKKFDELRGELADLARDQKDVADEAGRLQRRYAEEAADLMKEKAAEKRAELGELLGKLRRRVDQVPKEGVGQFVEEEIGAVRKRLDDIEKMLAEGDLAEALAMAREAEAGLEVVQGELEDAAEDEEDRRFRKAAERALEPVERAMPLARKLVDELEKATPSPGKILDKEDLERLEKLGRRQQALEQRAQKLAEKARGAAEQLPGEAGPRMADRIGEASGSMKRAAQRMRARDPSSARQEAREAAEKLEQAEEEAQGAARQQQAQGQRGLRDEPVRIPGADEYRAPEKFREDILDAMKKDEAPPSYREMVKRYYEELIR
ncbi:MAG TPA: DUF4175 family protein [Kofleriaceae bacterium]|nr:DUF4175 family protein [Kofleriaceae bacterium]